MQKRESQSSLSKWHHFRSSKRFIYFVVNLAVFTDAYLYGLIIPVLPFALSEYAGVPTQDLQKWIAILLGAYGAGLILGSPIAGHLADKSKSRRATYMLGLIALAVSTVMLSVGRSVAVLVVARSIQGASSAFVHCVGVSILSDTVGDDGVGPAMGYVTLFVATGMTTGPICGGLLYHRLGYSAVFVSAYVLVGIDVLFRVIMLERSVEQGGDTDTKPLLDDHAASASSPGSPSQQHLSQFYGSIHHDADTPPTTTTTTTTSLTNNPTPTATSPLTSPASSSSSSLLIPHPVHHHPPAPSPTLTLLLYPRYLLALLGSFTVSTLLTLLESTLPLYLSRAFDSNARDIGLILLALSLPSALSPLIGHLSDRWGARKIMWGGYVGLCPFWILLGLVGPVGEGGGEGGGRGGGGRNGGLQTQVVCLCIILTGLGTAIDCILTPAFAEAKGAADDLVVVVPDLHHHHDGRPPSPASEEEEAGSASEGGSANRTAESKDRGGRGGSKAYGAAFAAMNMAYATGTMCGPLVGGAVMQGLGGRDLQLGWRGLTMGTGVACAVCAGVVWGVGREGQGKKRR